MVAPFEQISPLTYEREQDQNRQSRRPSLAAPQWLAPVQPFPNGLRSPESHRADWSGSKSKLGAP